MSVLPPRVSRALYRAVLHSAWQLQHELSRCASLRPRELRLLKAAAAAPLPRELRGLLDVRPPGVGASALPLPRWAGVVARRLADAALAPELAAVETAAGFAALKHLNARVAALRHLVYDTASDAKRFGIHVAVESSYHGSDRERFFFRYQVRIENDSPETVQLLSRAWTIRDLDGRVTRVVGPGVVGVFPVLAPSEIYEYSSGVPLSTPVGTQSGHYVFIGKGERRMLHVPVKPFSYRAPVGEERNGRGEGRGGPVPDANGRSRNDDVTRR